MFDPQRWATNLMSCKMLIWLDRGQHKFLATQCPLERNMYRIWIWESWVHCACSCTLHVLVLPFVGKIGKTKGMIPWDDHELWGNQKDAKKPQVLDRVFNSIPILIQHVAPPFWPFWSNIFPDWLGSKGVTGGGKPPLGTTSSRSAWNLRSDWGFGSSTQTALPGDLGPPWRRGAFSEAPKSNHRVNDGWHSEGCTKSDL